MTNATEHRPGAVLLALVVLAAAVLLFRLPSLASNLESFPDSVEYATVGIRLATHGTFDITLNGASYPSTYQPWFSMLLLAPVYKLLGPEPGNGVLPVFLFGLAGIAAAFFVGRRVSGLAGGCLAALFVLILPDYRLCGRIVLTDVPAAAVVLALGAVYLRLRSDAAGAPRGLAAAAALLLGLAAALRPATAALVIPFLLLARAQSGGRKLWWAVLFLLPLLALAGMEAWFNACVFGDPFRNGRTFWCAVPWDYPALAFNAGYVRLNLSMLLESGAVYLAVVLGLLHLLVRRLRPVRDAVAAFSGDAYRALGLFVLLGIGPLVAFHLVFFYPDPRFFLPLTVLLAAAAGALAGRFLARVPPRTLVLAQAGVLALAVAIRFAQPPDVPKRKLAAEAIRDLTPSNAVIITGIDAAYLGTMLGAGDPRFIVPISRHVEYASKVICPVRVDHPDPPPAGPRDHRCRGLARGGAMDVIHITATENLDWIVEEMRKGRPVFMHTAVPAEDVPVVQELGARFVATQIAPWFYRLDLPPDEARRTGKQRKR